MRQFCQLTDTDRRVLLRHLEDEEYRNIMVVLESMPAITMECDMKGERGVMGVLRGGLTWWGRCSMGHVVRGGGEVGYQL